MTIFYYIMCAVVVVFGVLRPLLKLSYAKNYDSNGNPINAQAGQNLLPSIIVSIVFYSAALVLMFLQYQMYHSWIISWGKTACFGLLGYFVLEAYGSIFKVKKILRERIFILNMEHIWLSEKEKTPYEAIKHLNKYIENENGELMRLEKYIEQKYQGDIPTRLYANSKVFFSFVELLLRISVVGLIIIVIIMWGNS